MEDTYETVIAELVDRGWATTRKFLPMETIDALTAEAQALLDADELRRAGVGRAAGRTVEATVRGDLIMWLDEDEAERTPAHWSSSEAISSITKCCRRRSIASVSRAGSAADRCSTHRDDPASFTFLPCHRWCCRAPM